MTKLATQLRALKIFNEHGLLTNFGEQGRDVCVDYTRYDNRSFRIDGARVWSPSHKTDPDGHWTEYGAKFFSGRRSEALPKALAWATEKYGITEWLPSPFGGASSKLPAEAVKAAKQFVKEHYKELE